MWIGETTSYERTKQPVQSMSVERAILESKKGAKNAELVLHIKNKTKNCRFSQLPMIQGSNLEVPLLG